MEYALVSAKTFVLGLTIHCKGCEAKLKRRLERIHGVHKVSIDSNKGHITISSTIDPQTVISILEKYRQKAVLLWEQQPPPPKEDAITSFKGDESVQKMAGDYSKTIDQFGDSDMLQMFQQLSRENEHLKQAEVTIIKNFNVVFNDGKMIVETANSFSTGNNDNNNNNMSTGGEPVIGVPYMVSGQNIQGHHQHSCCCQLSGHMQNHNHQWPLPPAVGYYPPYQSVFSDENPNGCMII